MRSSRLSFITDFAFASLCAKFVNLQREPLLHSQQVRSNEAQYEKRTPNTDRPGDPGAVESVSNLFSICGSAAFQLAFGAEERGRADVSELLYSGRGLSALGRKETIRASLDDCFSSLVEHLPWRGDGLFKP